MKRAQKVAAAAAAATCTGRCPAALALERDLEESAAALDREAEENRRLRAEVERLTSELVQARALQRCRRGLSA